MLPEWKRGPGRLARSRLAVPAEPPTGWRPFEVNYPKRAADPGFKSRPGHQKSLFFEILAFDASKRGISDTLSLLLYFLPTHFHAVSRYG